MDEDDTPAQIISPLAALLKEDLGPQSIEDLERRIAKLTGEIDRVEAVIKSKKSVMGAAQGLFKP